MQSSPKEPKASWSDELLRRLVACPLCDGLIELPTLDDGQVVICRRCKGGVYHKKPNSLERSLAVSIAGLCLLMPSLWLPMIGLSTLGLSNEATLIESLLLLINDGFYLIATCLFVFTIAIPLVRLLVVCYVVSAIRQQRFSPRLVVVFRAYRRLDSWSMLHVYMLGIVVSMYKLVSLADLTLGLGLLSLCGLLLCSTLLTVTLDEHLIWERLEEGLAAAHR